MVNDGLIKEYHLTRLKLQRMSTKYEASLNSSEASSPPLSPTLGTKVLSSSAPENSFANHDDSVHDEDSVHLETNHLSATSKQAILKDEHKKQRKRFQPISKSQNSSPVRYDFVRPLKKQDECNDGSGTRTSVGTTSRSTKRRSSWRYLLSPSYKSRSDEFHKFFSDDISKNERLVADYSCALHREILIQGRIYISINYIAFYSNLFSWVTKLVIRLRDVTEIYKANTAKIIPNAIQFVTNKGEKHVFASFLARDKSYVMILRIWRNNLLKERMTDQEIRTIVHCGYGKDLGMSDSEELKINSPDSKSPANVQPLKSSVSIDGNNNSYDQKEQLSSESNFGADLSNTSCEPPPQRASSPLDLSDEVFGIQPLGNKEHGHARYNSIDYDMEPGKEAAQNRVIVELVTKLDALSKSQSKEEGSDDMSQRSSSLIVKGAPTYSPVANSTVVVDTPDSIAYRDQIRNGSDYLNISRESKAETSDEKSPGKGRGKSDDYADNNQDRIDWKQGKVAYSKTESQETVTKTTLGCVQTVRPHDQVEVTRDQSIGPKSSDRSDHVNRIKKNQQMKDEIEIKCGCKEHEGQFISDEKFDTDVDTLFFLIFTNSKFMRGHMVGRGAFDTTITKWKLPNSKGTLTLVETPSGNKSNSSTLSSECRRGSIDSQSFESSSIDCQKLSRVKEKQVRQLSYSININHILAKQVKVTETQKVCSVRPGVYVVNSSSLNSGAPYSDTFTIDITFCLTKQPQPNQSRMLVYCVVNFKKEKHSWKLAMMKSTIEKSSITGVSEYIANLTSSLKEYIDKKKKRKQRSSNGPSQPSVGGERCATVLNDRSSRKRILLQEQTKDLVGQQDFDSSVGSSSGQNASLKNKQDHRVDSDALKRAQQQKGLVRAKSKLVERKLRRMYKYYISNDGIDAKTNTKTRKGQLDNSADADNSSIGGSSDASSDCHSMSLNSVDEDDNGSMVMMINNDTESQLSETPENPNQIDPHYGRTRVEPHKLINRYFDIESLISGRRIVAFIIMSLLLIMIALSFSCLVILRRLDSIEQQLERVSCNQHS